MERWTNRKREVINSGVILDELWKCGAYQIFMFNFISIIFLCQVCWPFINYNFMHAAIPHHCRLPVNASLNETLPYDKISQTYEQCRMYVNVSDSNQYYENNASRPLQSCTDGFEFQPSGDFMNSSIVTEWSLICDSGYLLETSQTIFVSGIIAGSLLVPSSADRWGRKPVHIVCQILGVIVGVGLSFVPNFVGFMALNFFYGFFSGGVSLTGCVWVLELMPNRFRAMAGSGFQIYWVFWWCLLDIIAYFVRDWRWLQLVTALPPLLSLSFIWLAPESLTWLYTNRKFKEICHILRRRADRFNTRLFPEELIEQLERQDRNQTQNLVFASDGVLEIRGSDGPLIEIYTLLDIRKSRCLLLRTAALCYLWFQIISCNYGTRYLTNFSFENKYITILLTGLLQIPAFASAMFLCQHFGRVAPIILHQFVGGITLIIAAFLPNNLHMINLVLAIIVRYSFTFSFVVILFYTQEIYPTNLRVAGTGLNCALGQLTALIWPYATVLNNSVTWIPTLICGVLAIFGGAIVCLLPETKDYMFPETFEDLKAWPPFFLSKTRSANRLVELDSEYFNDNDSDNDEFSNVIFDTSFRS